MRGVVLLSGGLDSVVSAWLAAREVELTLALTCDYGQRAAGAEIQAAGRAAARLGIPQTVVPLPWVARVAPDALTSHGIPLPHPGAAELCGPAAEASARAVWVPNRNGLLVNIAAVYAEALDCGLIVCGFNAEEAATFPDNSPEFVQAVEGSLRLSTRNHVKILCPTLEMSKAAIVRAGIEVGAPVSEVWSCYEAGPEPCLRCESCQRYRRAMEAVETAEGR